MNAVLRLANCLILGAASAALAADRQEKRDVSGFRAIALAAPVDVDVVQGDTEGLVLEGDPEYLARVETVVENGTLRIRYTSRHEVWHTPKLRAHVSAKALESFSISGSGDIHSPGVRAEGFTISISGSGDVMVAGKVDRCETSIAGSGDFKAAKLESREARVSIAGSGEATLWARESVNVSIVGAGDVRYYGDPAVKKSVLGAGSVKRLGAAPAS